MPDTEQTEQKHLLPKSPLLLDVTLLCTTWLRKVADLQAVWIGAHSVRRTRTRGPWGSVLGPHSPVSFGAHPEPRLIKRSTGSGGNADCEITFLILRFLFGVEFYQQRIVQGSFFTVDGYYIKNKLQ